VHASGTAAEFMEPVDSNGRGNAEARQMKWQAYPWTVLTYAVAQALTLAIPPLSQNSPYLLFLAAVAFSAWQWGKWPGILSAVLPLVSTTLLLLSNGNEHLLLGDFIRMCAFAAASTLLITVLEKRRAAEDKLRSTEEHFRVVIGQTSDAITVLDDDGTVRFANPTVRRLLGFAPGEITGRPFIDFVHPDDRATVTEFLRARAEILTPNSAQQRALKAEPHAASLPTDAGVIASSCETVELHARCRDGSYRLVESSANLWEHAGEHGMVIVSRDISERRRAADTFRVLLESAPDGFIGVDRDGRISVVNSQAEQMFGYTREELLGATVEDLIPARMRQRHEAHREGYARTPQVRPMGARGVELIARRKDGTEFPVEISLSPIRTERGLLTATIIRDVTERRKAEMQKAALMREQTARAEAEAAQRRFYELVQDLDAIVWEMDLGTRRLTFVSRRATELLGYPQERWLGISGDWLEHVQPEDRESVRKFLSAVAEQGPSTIEYRARAANGHRFWLRLIVYVVRDQYNRARQLRGLTVDITERKQMEETLRTSEKLAVTGRLAASIAHELNNPMGAVINLLYLIENQPGADEHTRTYAQMAQREMNRVAHITRQMLGFYRDSTAPTNLNPVEVLERTLELHSSTMRDAGLTVDCNFEPVPAIHGFAGELRQVFSSLLLNAAEATSRNGRIRLKVTSSRDWGDLQRGGVRITVADNGSGIRPEDRQRVFEPFFTTKGENGTGLGLWVSLGIVRKHGGSISLRSSVREGHTGTVFSVFLPIQNSIGQPPGDATTQATQLGKAAASRSN